MKNKFLSNVVFSIVFVLVFCGVFIWADTNGVWHNPSDIREGIFGFDELASFFTFISNVTFEERVDFEELVDMNENSIVNVAPATAGDDVPNWDQVKSYVDAMNVEGGGDNYYGSGWFFDTNYSARFPVYTHDYFDNFVSPKKKVRGFYPLGQDYYVAPYDYGYDSSFTDTAEVIFYVFDKDGFRKKLKIDGLEGYMNFRINTLANGDLLIIVRTQNSNRNPFYRHYSYILNSDLEIKKLDEFQQGHPYLVTKGFKLYYSTPHYFLLAKEIEDPEDERSEMTIFSKYNYDGEIIGEGEDLIQPFTFSPYHYSIPLRDFNPSIDGTFSLLVLPKDTPGKYYVKYVDLNNMQVKENLQDDGALFNYYRLQRPVRLSNGNLLAGNLVVDLNDLENVRVLKFENPYDKESKVDFDGGLTIFNYLDGDRLFVRIDNRFYVYEVDLNTLEAKKISETIKMPVFRNLMPDWILPYDNSVLLIMDYLDEEPTESGTIVNQDFYTVRLINP